MKKYIVEIYLSALFVLASVGVSYNASHASYDVVSASPSYELSENQH